jgi:hypothetical protein
MRERRRVGAALIGVALLAVGTVWAIPNLAGRAFVEVRLVAWPAAGEPGWSQRRILLGGGPATVAGAIRLAVRIEGRYPLPVVVEATDPPLRIELRAQGEDGASRTVWSVTGTAAALEEGADSPDGPAVGKPVLIRPGELELPVGPALGVRLTDGADAGLAVGNYVLQAWAFGIPSGILQLTLLD